MYLHSNAQRVFKTTFKITGINLCVLARQTLVACHTKVFVPE